MKQRQVQLLGVLHRLLAGRAGAHQAAADGALNDALRAGIADPLSWAPSLGPNLGFVRSKATDAGSGKEAAGDFEGSAADEEAAAPLLARRKLRGARTAAGAAAAEGGRFRSRQGVPEDGDGEGPGWRSRAGREGPSGGLFSRAELRALQEQDETEDFESRSKSRSKAASTGSSYSSVGSDAREERQRVGSSSRGGGTAGRSLRGGRGGGSSDRYRDHDHDDEWARSGSKGRGSRFLQYLDDEDGDGDDVVEGGGSSRYGSGRGGGRGGRGGRDGGRASSNRLQEDYYVEVRGPRGGSRRAFPDEDRGEVFGGPRDRTPGTREVFRGLGKPGAGREWEGEREGSRGRAGSRYGRASRDDQDLEERDEEEEWERESRGRSSSSRSSSREAGPPSKSWRQEKGPGAEDGGRGAKGGSRRAGGGVRPPGDDALFVDFEAEAAAAAAARRAAEAGAASSSSSSVKEGGSSSRSSGKAGREDAEQQQQGQGQGQGALKKSGVAGRQQGAGGKEQPSSQQQALPEHWMYGMPHKAVREASVTDQLGILLENVKIWGPKLSTQDVLLGMGSVGSALAAGKGQAPGRARKGQQAVSPPDAAATQLAAQRVLERLSRRLGQLGLPGCLKDAHGPDLARAVSTMGQARYIPPAGVLSALLQELLSEGGAKLLHSPELSWLQALRGMSLLHTKVQELAATQPQPSAASSPVAAGAAGSSTGSSPSSSSGGGSGGAEGAPEAQRLLTLHGELVNFVSSILASGAEAISPNTLAQMASSLAWSGCTRKEVYEAIATALDAAPTRPSSVLPGDFRTESLAQLGIAVRSLASSNTYAPKLLDTVGRLCGQELKVIKPQAWADLLYAFSHFGHPCPTLLDALVQQLPGKVGQLGPQRLSLLALSLANLGHTDKATFEVLYGAVRGQQGVADLGGNPSAASILLHAFAKAGFNPEPEFLQSLCQGLLNNMQASLATAPATAAGNSSGPGTEVVAGQAIKAVTGGSRLLKGLLQLGHLDPQITSQVLSAVTSCAPRMNPTSLAHCAHTAALAAALCAQGSKEGGASEALKKQCEDAVVALTREAMLQLGQGAAADAGAADEAASAPLDTASSAVAAVASRSPVAVPLEDSLASLLSMAVATVRALGRGGELPSGKVAEKALRQDPTPVQQPACPDVPYLSAVLPAWALPLQDLVVGQGDAAGPAPRAAAPLAAASAAAEPGPASSNGTEGAPAATAAAAAASSQAAPAPLSSTEQLAFALSASLMDGQLRPGISPDPHPYQRLLVSEGCLVVAGAVLQGTAGVPPVQAGQPAATQQTASEPPCQPVAVILLGGQQQQQRQQQQGAGPVNTKLNPGTTAYRRWLLERAGCKVVEVKLEEWERVREFDAAASAFLKHACGQL